MRWETVRLIFAREIRDQLRDRRTLFIMVGIPLILYPALGFLLTKLTQRMKASSRQRLGIVGAAHLPASPPLFTPRVDRFVETLFDEPNRQGILEVLPNENWSDQDVKAGRLEALLVVPRDAATKLKGDGAVALKLHHNSADERSDACFLNTAMLLERWGRLVAAERLIRLGKPLEFVDPVRIEDAGRNDVAVVKRQSGLIWGRMIPFVLVMMALTGAFYPAVDLCAGEKERGTMETLLISPAARSEIVVGKFLTIWVFAVCTTAFNLASLALTFSQAAPALPVQGGMLTAPPAPAVVGILAIMAPLAAFFAAWCLALSAFARSTKEGQYYLMPLFLVVTPLVFVTLTPGMELTPVTCLAPVTNAALLMRTLLMADYERALNYSLLVLAPTLIYGYLALRWAIDQFHREEVLFREAEQIEPRLVLKHLLRTKEPTPSPGEAFFGYALALGLSCLVFLSGRPLGLKSIAVAEVALAAFPLVAWALLLTSDPIRTLRLRLPEWRDLLLGAGLALLLHPAMLATMQSMRRLYPPSPEFPGLLEPPFDSVVSLGAAFIVLAALRAVCEEVVFRGFVLVGLQSRYPAALAILIGGLLSGAFRMSPWQMPSAALLAMVLGVVATRTGSIWPGAVLATIHYLLLLPHFQKGLSQWTLMPAGGAEMPLVFASAVGGALAVATILRRPVRN